ncbi:hypothetical protein JL58_13460 [Listeria ivanovii subsp. londoniensis]|uniref:SMI1/KNR4 family protein n=1 Tax=Listeria ivanovii subsp. londoniensis TaxID=202752 RepID=A0ABS1G8T0_LISIV|nr:SMI1/KNR4 family protein [Listeria ivanovii]AIS61221.1 hypothetical protein JL58_13460 [Listeria ivanovii subsp. londoniensis]MBK1963284.1 SMI1/KNR4 family protein [Listeria ivanovii subsp. londoniensis]
MNRIDIEKLINKYEEEYDFTDKISMEQIKLVENNLGISFSSDYVWFLENYGSGGVLGIDVLGIARNNIATVENITERLRKEFNLDNKMYIVEDCDEFFYCGKSGEDKIYYWDREEGIGKVEAGSFLEFLQNRIIGAAENFE